MQVLKSVMYVYSTMNQGSYTKDWQTFAGQDVSENQKSLTEESSISSPAAIANEK